MSNASAAVSASNPDDKEDPQHGPTVTIKVNGIDRPIHRGRQTVEKIKNAGQVPLADDLEQVIDGKLTPLRDDGAVTIKGGEVFVSHPKDSGSSFH